MAINKLLSIDELRQMNGEPVWVEVIDKTNFADPRDAFDAYGLVRKSWVRVWDAARADLITIDYHFEEYGKTWIAFCRKPKDKQKRRARWYAADYGYWCSGCCWSEPDKSKEQCPHCGAFMETGK